MNWEAIGAVGEIVGAIAVVVSIVYLAVQIRQNTKASKAATVQDMTNKWVQINLWSAESPERSFDLTSVEPGSKEFLQALAWYRVLFHQWSNNYYQYRNGVLDDTSFQPTLREITHIVNGTTAGPSVRLAWATACHVYNDDFGEIVDGILGQTQDDA